ncbi:hypothetical protein HanPSC8_Chr14g0628841 [Helianthus annuus]|nr:hypothetical protein HanPSC8_Chr14g0628841 [Helianthus annuus]
MNSTSPKTHEFYYYFFIILYRNGVYFYLYFIHCLIKVGCNRLCFYNIIKKSKKNFE